MAISVTLKTRSELSFGMFMRASVIIVASACALPTDAVSQETVTIENIPGQRIDANWYRYLNARYGIGVDIPATGFSYELSDNGDEVALSSADGEKSIAIYTSEDIDEHESEPDPVSAFATFAEEQIDALRLGAVNIVHDRIERLWFEFSTTDEEFIYYQKGVLSPNCPTFTTTLWIKYPKAAAKEFDTVFQRMASSLIVNCAPAE